MLPLVVPIIHDDKQKRADEFLSELQTFFDQQENLKPLSPNERHGNSDFFVRGAFARYFTVLPKTYLAKMSETL